MGKDATIQSIVPHFKVDALLRKKDLDRYDDRLEVRTNLIEAYEILMGFIQKHLPDPFYEENGVRISLRAKIFREVIANILVHSEYMTPAFARLIIYKDRVETENPSKSYRSGAITLENLSPKPKNPLISKLFIHIGRVEELGSGVRRTNQYVPIYANGQLPKFIEGDIFKTILPSPLLEKETSGGVNGGVNGGVSKYYLPILQAVNSKKAVRTTQLRDLLQVSRRTIERNLRDLKNANLIVFEGSPKTGHYVLTSKGKKTLKDGSIQLKITDPE